MLRAHTVFKRYFLSSFGFSFSEMGLMHMANNGQESAVGATGHPPMLWLFWSALSGVCSGFTKKMHIELAKNPQWRRRKSSLSLSVGISSIPLSHCDGRVVFIHTAAAGET